MPPQIAFCDQARLRHLATAESKEIPAITWPIAEFADVPAAAGAGP